MTIEFNHETHEVTVDQETVNRLTKGTPFQRSMNLVAMLDEVLSEMDAEFAKSAGLNPEQRRAMAERMRKSRAEYLRNNPPPMPDFDPAAIDVYSEN